MSVVFLFLLLVVLLYFSHITSKGVLLSPQFGFAASFIPQVMLAIFYIKKWNLNLILETIFVIAGGVLIFTLSSCLFYYTTRPSLINRKKNINEEYLVVEDEQIEIENWKLIFLILFQLLSILLCVRYLLSLSVGIKLFDAITYYRYTNLFAENTFIIPSYCRMIRTFCVSSGYMFVYLFIHSSFYDDKINKFFLLVNIVLSIINDIMFGARTGLATIIVAFVVQYYFIRGRKLGWKKALPFKTIIKIVVFTLIFVGTFQTMAELMGRTLASQYTFMDYIAGYLSAPLKNLDVFLRKGVFGSTIENNQTFNGVIPFLAKLFNHPEWIHKLDLPFVLESGYNFGNVYTVFYSFIYDMGYWGLFVFLPIMAFVCQFLYNRILFEKNKKSISVNTVAYSYIYFAILFSFFSSKFYETVFNTKFIWTVVSWFALNIFFKIRIRIRNN